MPKPSRPTIDGSSGKAASAKLGGTGDQAVRRIRYPDARTHRQAPYVVVLQSEMLPAVSTVVVAPIRSEALAEGMTEIQVPVVLDGEAYAVLVLELAHVPSRMLRRSVGRLLAYEFNIRRGLDRVFTGF